MKKLFNIFLFCCVIGGGVFAQSGNLIVEGTAPKLYLQHTVVAKENWYSIGRLYNVSPKEIAPFNGVTLDKGLNIGESIKIPLTAANFTQTNSKAADEVFVPVYHVAQDKETFYKLSSTYKASADDLEQWNGNSVKVGQKMIVGYLKVKPAQSALASQGNNSISSVAAIAKKETVAPPVVEKAEPVAVATAQKQVTTVALQPAVTEAKQVVTTAASTVSNNIPSNTSSGSSVDYKGGYFKAQFANGSGAAQGSAAVFRSTSGWNDGKYYVLMNIPVGTIVKVTNPVNNKNVYAKVLGNLDDIKENNGLALRISNAAAVELGASENGRFTVDVKY